MTSRKALIIGAPDKKIPGVKVDIENLEGYLKSPIGGFWRDSEITTLVSPSAIEIKRQIELLKINDYSLVFFAGHGFHSNQRGSTILHINSSETLDSLELRVGAQKHTVILDCCREAQDEQFIAKATMDSMILNYAEGQKVSALECRKYFDKAISDCAKGIVIMNSCSLDELANESETRGGYYTSSLIESANEWAKMKLMSIDLQKKYATYSTQECHDAASGKVKRLSGGRQNPNFESPRADKKFPFSVVA
ncbi:hypothetical protein CBP51_03145 [Cellvibrio mixtus]|uniref:Peptidase C14 caspase domain-containing protein n=1 Tax=Cellvibrio mixtus TaxID=39650 RepID=A0A266Q9K1_9GAMM|nr:caspase family protein [Cellvibrio mixtus]OZY86041.1 hypothetical protein CBP51_03145 [Cellvibrio mixtus]